MCFAHHGGSEHRFPFCWVVRRDIASAQEALDVIEDPRGGAPERCPSYGVGVVSAVEVVDLLLGQIRGETFKGIAQILVDLAHNRGADHHAEYIEANRCAIPIRIGHQCRLEHPVVICDSYRISYGIHCSRHKEIQEVIIYGGTVAERVLEAAW